MTYPDTYVTNLYWKWEKRRKKLKRDLKRLDKVGLGRSASDIYMEIGALEICMYDLGDLKAKLIDWERRRGILKKR